MSEHKANLSSAHAYIACRNVGIRPDMAGQLRHEALAEAHNLRVALGLRVEIRPSLASAHHQPGEGILQNLLEAEELDYAKVNGRVEPDASLVRPQSTVEFNAKTTVDTKITLVVLPWNAENQLPLRLDHALKNAGADVLGVSLKHGRKTVQDLFDRLVELWLTGIAFEHLFVNSLDNRFCCHLVTSVKYLDF